MGDRSIYWLGIPVDDELKHMGASMLWETAQKRSRSPNAGQLKVSVVHCVVHSMVRPSSTVPQPIDAGV